jgi:hypothetical protein
MTPTAQKLYDLLPPDQWILAKSIDWGKDFNQAVNRLYLKYKFVDFKLVEGDQYLRRKTDPEIFEQIRKNMKTPITKFVR